MKLHKNARTTPNLRASIIERLQAGETQSSLALAVGVSTATIRKWRRRFEVGGLTELNDRSSRPHRLRTKATDDQRASIEALRRERLPLRTIATMVGLSRATVARIANSCDRP